MKKYLILSLSVLLPVLLLAGCGSDKNASKKQGAEVIKYNSGTIMIRDKNTSDDSSEDYFSPGSNVDVGPGDVQFGPENNF